MTIALSGRRIDPVEAEPSRFPLGNVDLVRNRLLTLFDGYSRSTLVCSAACGADLLALDIAGLLGWRRRVILPFEPKRFRDTSVTDRPGDWGRLYDRILDEVTSAGDLVVNPAPAGANVYSSTNEYILTETGSVAAGCGEVQVAVVVWDGKISGPDDATNGFAVAAGERGITVLEVSTLE
jgi:hypothetical protein